MLRLRGGGPPTIKFNNQNEPKIVKFAKTAPKWSRIAPGFNLKGVCINKNCEAHKQKVWIPKRYGRFNITREVYTAKCPICQ